MKAMDLNKKRMMMGYLFILPWIIGFLLFLTYPLVHSFWLGFNRLTNLRSLQTTFIGLDNYRRAFFVDTNYLPFFTQNISQALIQTPLIIVFSLILAILLNKDIKARGLFRAMFFLPMLLGTGFIMQQLVGEGSPSEAMQQGITIPGLIFLYLGPELGGIVQDILNNLSGVLWRSSVQIILFLSGLQGVPIAMYEAARCDGATSWEEFWKITLPMISPVLLLNVVYTLIDAFSDGTSTLMAYVTFVSFERLQFGYGAALGWIYFITTMSIVLIVFGFLSKFVVYLGEK